MVLHAASPSRVQRLLTYSMLWESLEGGKLLDFYWSSVSQGHGTLLSYGTSTSQCLCSGKWNQLGNPESICYWDLIEKVLGELKEPQDVVTQRFRTAGNGCNPKGECGVPRTWDTLVSATREVTQRVQRPARGTQNLEAHSKWWDYWGEAKPCFWEDRSGLSCECWICGRTLESTAISWRKCCPL